MAWVGTRMPLKHRALPDVNPLRDGREEQLMAPQCFGHRWLIRIEVIGVGSLTQGLVPHRRSQASVRSYLGVSTPPEALSRAGGLLEFTSARP